MISEQKTTSVFWTWQYSHFIFGLYFLRFSHSPLIDEDDEDEEAKEPMLNEAFGKFYTF